jgi:hypothetical protein
MNYQEGKIYKIVGSGLTYYGSTKQTLKARINKHKYQKCCSSKQIINNGNYEILLIELFPCNTKEELKTRERWYIENNDCVNKYIPNRTKKEWYTENKDKNDETTKQYAIINKEKIQEYKKQYRINNANKLNQKQKQYAIDNKEKIQEYKKQYYIKFKQDNQ